MKENGKQMAFFLLKRTKGGKIGRQVRFKKEKEKEGSYVESLGDNLLK